MEKWRTAAYAAPYLTETYAWGAPSSQNLTPRERGDRVQVVSTEGHPFHLLGRTSKLDIGGPFTNRKVVMELDQKEPEWSRYNWSAYFKAWQNESYTIPVPASVFSQIAGSHGTINTKSSATSFVEQRCPQVFSSNELDAWGTSVINSVRPTNPTVDLAMSIGEFVSERKFFALPGTSGSLPGEYLNYMFGIAPTIADVQDLRTAIEDREEIIRQYARDSGRLVRRRYEPAPETDVTKVVSTGIYPAFIGASISGGAISSGTLTRTTKKKTRLWFSGAFTYYLPEEGLGRDLAEMDRLYGVVPGTALVWELLPFSWLLDYKLSIGATLGNLDSFIQDGLVMPYAYVMAEQEVVDHYEWEGTICNPGGTPVPRRVTGRIKYVTQQRQAATPFGFGIKPGDLTTRQLSIIAALGLTKLDK